MRCIWSYLFLSLDSRCYDEYQWTLRSAVDRFQLTPRLKLFSEITPTFVFPSTVHGTKTGPHEGSCFLVPWPPKVGNSTSSLHLHDGLIRVAILGVNLVCTTLLWNAACGLETYKNPTFCGLLSKFLEVFFLRTTLRIITLLISNYCLHSKVETHATNVQE